MKHGFFRRLLLLMIACGSVSSFGGSPSTDSLIDLKTSNGSALRYLLTLPGSPSLRMGVVLFAGGDGQVHLNKGLPDAKSNFLVRSRALFADEGLAVAVFDPSAESGPLSDWARMSAEHQQEVSTVINDFKSRTGINKVYLVGTSRGTISASYLADSLKTDISGVILTSTLFRASKAGPGLSTFDFSSIKQPLLFVHNSEDGCKTTPPDAARSQSQKFKVIWINGRLGDGDGNECGPFSAHGFLGREKETVHVISDWIFQAQSIPR